MDLFCVLVIIFICDLISDIDFLCGSFLFGVFVLVFGRWEVVWNWKVGDVVVGKESSGGFCFY